MTCTEARDAVLVADPTALVHPTDAALANHLHSCAPCAEMARALGADLEMLRGGVRRRSKRRVATIAIAAALPIAAGIIAILVSRRATPIVIEPPAASTASISVDVPPGKQATVFATKDPKVTIVWITPESGL
jgi:hypothetical protein